MSDEQPDRRAGEDRRQDVPVEASALMRMVDFRIPLWGLIVVMAGGLGALTSTHYQLQKVDENLKELTLIVRSNNALSNTIAADMALTKYRLSNLENNARRDSDPPRSVR